VKRDEFLTAVEASKPANNTDASLYDDPVPVAPLPTVSVVMPMYNASRYVGDAVLSVMAQTFRDFELIVIDDGSTDGSALTVRRAVGNPVQLRLIHQENKGVSAAANRGTELARGEFIARMDADDIALPSRLERQVEFLRGHPDYVAVGSRVMFIDDEGDDLYEMPGIHLTHEDIDRGLMEVEWAILQPAAMMRTEAMRKVGGYRADLHIHEDHDLFLKLAEIGKLANLPEVLLRYRQRPDSAVSVYADSHVESFRSVYEDAWKRRGLIGKKPIPYIAPHPDDPHRLLKRHRLWSWMSLKAGNNKTARKYARAALRLAPFSPQSWNLMYCALRGR
jgi:glycosyltransferase involved in cell wall biosynthesis